MKEDHLNTPKGNKFHGHLSAPQFEEESKETRVVYMLIGKLVGGQVEGSNQPKEIQALLKDFEELVSEELPNGLPPIRSIQHAIDLVPRAKLPNQTAYGMPPNHRTEMRRQVEDLIAKGLARRTPSMESVDSSGEEELAIRRLEITKNDLRNRIAKESKGNAILQASLERRKQALHERRLALEQDVSRLQEQLQAERDLRAALESLMVYTNMKTRAELEEIALAEADVARLKQKVAELHHQLNQQSQNYHGSPSDACNRYQHIQNLLSQHHLDCNCFFSHLNSSIKCHFNGLLQECSSGADWGNIKGQVLPYSSSSKQLSWKQCADSTSLGDSKSTEASTSLSVDELSGVDSATMPSISRPAEGIEYQRHPSTASSSSLVELTTRLDFFKERRSQLMEQLHNLDLNYGTSSSQGFMYKPSSPPGTNCPR
ncbi:hypothetical protein HHK36_017170 [Tetracentron sinense]|uniref:Ternary complex factor MIP1 leucine-zipper domain-containing protein n=1 Tax=Tetracentron sinense TaxID=13715 RepID=A0A834Z4Q4_TETSI|nr:hypothetical protein HHK36_017170 [Tetracentron sinense]